MSDQIEHISDTALLVAAARAAETKLEDGLVRDPYAARLAGERGIAIARSGSPSRWRSFGIGLRSRFIDELLLAELRDPMVDCVLCLGAGLDARPWRLPLSNSLRWIEVDFAPILDYKYKVLADVAPGCRLERITADLNERADRQRIVKEALGESSRVLLLTEGLLFYLPADTVRSMAKEMAACYRWLMDISPSTSLILASGGDAMRQANELRHESRLEGAEILDLIRSSGWTAAASKTFMKDGAHLPLDE
ncbi:MAG: class I SAM-dependent methyltransferase [Bryobacteraceae bacterium]